MQDAFSPTDRCRSLTTRGARWTQAVTAACALAACGGGGGGDDTAAAPSGGAALACPAPVATLATSGAAPAASPAPAPSGAVVVTGTATYDFVPTQGDGTGLDYAGTVRRPIRGANVELLASGGAVLATTTTDELGRYGFGLASAQPVTVRVRAEIKRSGASGAGRDFTVRDNTSGEALYVLDFGPFTPTAPSQTVDVNAPSGWGGNGYTGPRTAAPFAILDVVYAAQVKVATADGSVALPPLQVFWSPNNQPVDGDDPSTGNIGTSFFTSGGGTRALYLLGKENTDTDEYDSHIVAHEFGHYLQSALSRDDSVGGAHSLGDRLDMRVAFSEGWGNAWSGMVLGSPVYSDSVDANQAGGFTLNVSEAPSGNRGSYSEASAQYLLWTTHQDAAIGFGPVYAALRSLAAAPTFSSLYSFAAQLKAAVPAEAAGITSLWSGQQIAAQDNCGTGETNAGGNAASLPVYKQHTAALGVAQNYCVNATADPDNDGNKLARNVFVLFAAQGARTVTATRSGGDFSGASDPDLVLVKSDGSKVIANAEITPTQALSTSLPTGTHVLALEDFNLTSPSTSCFNLTVN